jgi:hypothetical protein
MKISMSVLGKCIVEDEVVPKWQPFYSYLQKRGFEPVSIKSNSSSFHVDLECEGSYVLEFSSHLPSDRKVLIRVEPKCVNPFQYRSEINSIYSNHIVIASKFKTKSESIIWENGHLPERNVLSEILASTKYLNDRVGICLLNQNKFSSVPGELYSLRRLAMNRFVNADIRFELGGRDWDESYVWEFKSKIKNYVANFKSSKLISFSNFFTKLNKKSKNLVMVGSIDDTFKFLSSFEFCLVIENENTYVSEKLLNAVISGCIPIYVGPKLADFGFPANIAIEVGGDTEKIVDIYRNTTPEEKVVIRKAGRIWIESEESYKRWGIEPGFNKLADLLFEIYSYT